ncbi:unnamed protein product [Adineta ricciae]|uniref:Major facilitator superfamily (MFS) profile domain-containing protein n=1 Tax=Adineta ricciae TaxID=249248 RepID=A0A815S347_ADIRI|nr:unnamed protein product [Adineta ricciae]
MKRFQRDDTMALPEDSALLSKRLLKPSADENLQLLPRQCTEENDEEGVADGASQSSSHAAIPQSSVFELIRVKLTILIDNDKISLRQICFIWASFGGLLLISSFLFLDWKFTFLNLSYQFDRKQDKITTRNPESSEIINNGKKWYKRIYKRLGSWEYLSSPLYIMIVLFLSTLFITTDLLAITWYPMNYDLYNHDASLGFAQPGQDHLIFIHTVFTAFSGSCTMVTTYASSAYFSKSRAFISTIFTGAGIISGIWFTIFQILIDNNKISLRQICFIWASFGVLLLISSFLFLDWKFPFLNLSYQFDTKQDEITMRNPESSETTNNEKKWYKRIYKRLGIWKYLTSPLYIMIVLFLSTLFITTDLLAITWYPMNYDLYNHDASLATKYTNAFNFSILSGIFICPAAGYFLGFRAHQNRKQKILNILILQILTWLLCIIICLICIFISTKSIIPLIILSCFIRSILSGGPQAIVVTYFPTRYIGTLTGIMWTMVGVLTFVQYGLVPLTTDISKLWRAWLIVLILVLIVIIHLFQILRLYIEEKRNTQADKEKVDEKEKNIEQSFNEIIITRL